MGRNAAALAVVLLAGLAAAQVPAGARQAAAAPPAAQQGDEDVTLIDRVVAVVDEDAILESDIDRVIGLGLATPNPGEDDRQFRRRVLEELIDQRLRFHEIDRFGFGQVPVEEIEKQVAEVRDRLGGQAELERRLRELGLTVNGLRQLFARQLQALTYVQERLGPRVFVGAEEITANYNNVLVPEMKRQGQPVPPLAEVRERILGILREQHLNQEIVKWTEELRQKADVENFFDTRTGPPLPPVVRRIDQPAKPESPANRPASPPR
jgi:peptidyl-prolyl cis-trans isomerase SurA